MGKGAEKGVEAEREKRQRGERRDRRKRGRSGGKFDNSLRRHLEVCSWHLKIDSRYAGKHFIV